LSIDGNPQLHAAIGQPLSVSVPITLAGDEVSRLYYRLTPGNGLADAEERAAAAVHASYDPGGSAVLLSTGERMDVPALRLHLEIGAGDVVVSRELTVLFDVPDLNKSSPLESPSVRVGQVVPTTPGARPAPAAAPSPGLPGGAQSIAISKEEDQKTAIAYGDAAAGHTPVGAAPSKVELVVAPRPKYYNSYQVKAGDTLNSIATHFARAGAGSVDAVMLAVYEANIDDFPAGNPQHPIVGRMLGIPDAPSIGSEPGYRIAEFRDYLRKPVGEWQVPVTLMRKVADEPPPPPKQEVAPAWLNLRNGIGGAVLLLILWGLRNLFAAGKHKRTTAARRAASSGGASVISNLLLESVEPPPREPVVDLMNVAAPEAEQSEISRLRELLEQQPGRADIRLRLVQRLFEARRAGGFAEVALPLETVLSPEAWERVRAMGHELLPSDYRFQPQAGIAPAADLQAMPEHQDAPVARPETIDFDFHGAMAQADKTRKDVFGGS
jgi:Tfp pilus assembly protein FimV